MKTLPSSGAKTWISYLAQHGPGSSNNNLYDEKQTANARRSGITQIEIKNPIDELVLAKIHEWSGGGKSGVILVSGMAGDGKTSCLRRVWSKLVPEGTDIDEYWTKKRFPSTVIKSGDGKDYKVSFVKDFSDRRNDDPVGDNDPMSMTRVPERTCRIIACNHGRILDQIRQSGEVPELSILADKLEKNFFESRNEVVLKDFSGIEIYLLDMSLCDPAENFRAILTEICGNEYWSGCGQCHCRNVCPILANRRALWDEEVRTLKRPAIRQVELVRLIGCGGVHLPFRDLMVVAANNLLGKRKLDDKRGTKKLLDCAQIWAAAKKGEALDSYVFLNLLGSNLTPDAKKNNLVYRFIGNFGVGSHAPRSYDKRLTAPEDGGIALGVEPDAAKRLWGLSRSVEDRHGKELLIMRRQAVFFSIDEAAPMNRWNLTAFSFGREYLKLLEHEKADYAGDKVALGMSRIFTGQFREEQSVVYVTTAGTDSKAPQGELLMCQINVRPSNKRRFGREGLFVERDRSGQLMLVIKEEGEDLVRAELTPALYEFFRRTAQGCVVSGFSKECRSQAQQLKNRLITALSNGIGDDQPLDDVLRLLPMLDSSITDINLEACNG